MLSSFWILLAASGFWAVIAIVVGLATYRLAKKRFALDERINLSIRVNPTRMGRRQMAQFMLHNQGKRPVNVIAWGYGGASQRRDSTLVESFGPTCTSPCDQLPILLKEQESCDFTVFIDEIPLDEITSFHIQDKGQRFYKADDTEVRSFLAIAKQYASN